MMSELSVALGAELLKQRVDLVEEKEEPAAATDGRWKDAGVAIVGALRCADNAQGSAQLYELPAAGVRHCC